MTAGYKLSATLVGLTDSALLPALGLLDPKSDFEPAATQQRTVSGHGKYLGYPEAFWNYGFLTPAQRAIFKTYCTGASSEVFIETLADDDTWKQYQAIMHWSEEKKDLTKVRIGFSITFTNLEIIT